MLALIQDRNSLKQRWQRNQKYLESNIPIAQKVLNRIREEGDSAVRAFTEQFDHVKITGFRVPVDRLKQAEEGLSTILKSFILEAGENIRRFHKLQQPAGYALEQPDGTQVEFRWRPIERIGVYIPGGRFPLFSTILMNVIPAQVAGVSEIVICTPPGKDGWPSEVVLATCFLLGVTEVYRVGGVQAIGALTYGTDSIPAVDKITGPGNVYVAAAKQAVSAVVDIDMISGPTELIIIADDEADPSKIAVELISQAEHDPQALPVLLTDSETVARDVNELLPTFLKDLPTRHTAERSLKEQGFIYLADTIEECVQIANDLTPEHLSLMVSEPELWVDNLKAGAIFIGPDSPVAWGDYWAGTNHTLPTSGQARTRGPLTVLDFMVPYSVIRISKQTLRNSGKKVISLAEAEGLFGHAQSIVLLRKNA